MSKDMLGSLVRASVNLTQPQLNLSVDVMNRFTGNDGAAWESHLKSVLRSGLPNEPKQVPAPKPSVLIPANDSVQLDPIASYDPKGFKTRKGLCVSDEFHRRVGLKAKPVKDVAAITLTSGDLVKNAYDKDIKSDPVMPANHVFESESDFVAYLDQMISKRPNGEEGDLLNNGYLNIFYVAGCVVGVGWSSGYRKWRVRAWNLDDGGWRACYRVFSRN